MDTIQLTVGGVTIVLNGAGVTGAVRGARLLPANGAGETLEEPIELVLEGTSAEIETAIESIGRLVDQARQGAGGVVGSWGYLEVKLAAGGVIWRSKIVDGWPVYSQEGAGQRARGRMGVTLHLVRANWWEGPESALALTNLHGTNVTTGLTITNHEDGAHANSVNIGAASLLGDLPAPARIELSVTTAETGTVWAGLNQDSDPTNLKVNYPAEAAGAGSGVTMTVLTDGLYASGGSAKRFAWTGTGITGLVRFTLSAADLARMGGRPFRGVLRFYSQPAGNVWAWWRLLYVAGVTEVIWEGPGQYLSDLMVVQDLPGLFLPPWGVPAGASAPGLTLELAGQSPTAGAHQIELDELYLFPMDGWRKYAPVIKQWTGLSVNDDSGRDLVQAVGVAMQGHAAEGPGFWLKPGKAARLTFLIGQRLLANIAVVATVKVFYRPRRRGL